MAPATELQVQEKRELEKRDESTVPARIFMPITDIFETDDALTVVMEMPGVEKANIDIGIENDVLTIGGRIDFAKYEKLHPVYTEYNIGHYRRRFTIPSSQFNRDKILAEMNDGVLTRYRKPRKPSRAASRSINLSSNCASLQGGPCLVGKAALF